MSIEGALLRGAAHAAGHGAREAAYAGRIAARRAELEARGAEAARGGTVAVREPGSVVIQREQIDGNALLNGVYTALGHFAVWPSEAAHVTAVLWAAHAHGKDEKTGIPIWQYSPHLFFTSTEGGSGKSLMGRLVAKLSPNGKMLVESTKASLVRLIAKQATVVVTELDVLVGNGGRNKWFTGIANASYERDQATYRIDHGKELEIPLMCPMILDGLDTVITSTGTEMRTLMSRCIIVRVKRAPAGYRAPRFDDTARAVFARGGEKLSMWMAQQVREGIADYVPEVPEGLGNRPASLWEPLFAAADAAGGEWPERARQACADLELAAEVNEDDEEEAAYQATLAAWAAAGSPATRGTEESRVDEMAAYVRENPWARLDDEED